MTAVHERNAQSLGCGIEHQLSRVKEVDRRGLRVEQAYGPAPLVIGVGHVAMNEDGQTLELTWLGQGLPIDPQAGRCDREYLVPVQPLGIK